MKINELVSGKSYKLRLKNGFITADEYCVGPEGHLFIRECGIISLHTVRYNEAIEMDFEPVVEMEKSDRLSDKVKASDAPNIPHTVKPPLGVMPKWLWTEQRVAGLAKAIKRYAIDEKAIPQEWIDEYNECIKYIDSRKGEK